MRSILGERRYSQADVVRGTDLSANYLSERLRDEKSFTLSDVETLADFFGMEVDELLLMATRRVENVGADDDTDALAEIEVLSRAASRQVEYGKAAKARQRNRSDQDDQQL